MTVANTNMTGLTTTEGGAIIILKRLFTRSCSTSAYDRLPSANARPIQDGPRHAAHLPVRKPERHAQGSPLKVA